MEKTIQFSKTFNNILTLTLNLKKPIEAMVKLFDDNEKEFFTKSPNAIMLLSDQLKEVTSLFERMNCTQSF